MSANEIFNGPPPDPWQSLSVKENAGGYLSFYFSESFSTVPIRSVSKVRDNKSDPNLETKTYGLFSTCSKSMRKAVVDRGAGKIFFATRFKGRLCIPGMYEIGWFAPSGFSPDDYCLAAKNIHFVEDPLPIEVYKATLRFRGIRRLSRIEVERIESALVLKKDRTALYLSEIDRAERFNARHTGFRYTNFKKTKSFDWGDGLDILKKGSLSGFSSSQVNNSETDHWICGKCKNVSISKSLLKLCPHCGAYASLTPSKHEK